MKEINSYNKLWREFDIGDILQPETKECKAQFAQDEYEKGEVYLIGAKNNSNGIVAKVTCSKETPIANVIGINTQGQGGAGLAFYHPFPSIFSSTVLPVKLTNENMTEMKGIFIAKLISKALKPKYGFGISAKWGRIKNEKILLPITKNNKGLFEPDWKWIEKFMVSEIAKVEKERLKEILLK